MEMDGLEGSPDEPLALGDSWEEACGLPGHKGSGLMISPSFLQEGFPLLVDHWRAGAS